jgi:hypothetical protein
MLTPASNSPSFCATVPLYPSPGAAQAPLIGLGCNTFASTLYMATAALPTAAVTNAATTPPTLPAPTVTVTSAPRATPVGTIVGAVLGGVAFLAVLAMACAFAAAALRRRGRSRRGGLAWFSGDGRGESRGPVTDGGTTEVVHSKALDGAAVEPPRELPAAGSEVSEMASSGDELRFSLPANYSPSPVLQEARAVPLRRVGELPAGVVAISELPDSEVRRVEDDEDDIRHLGVAI